MDTKLQNNRFKELDALRGIAALMVVLFHFTMGKPEATLGFKLGTTGVDLFFVISGFVIYMSVNKAKTSLDFVINRISRLYPTYWACVTVTFIVIAINSYNKNGGLDQIDLKSYLGNMTMFQFYLGIKDLDNPYWTMIIEMIFYIVIVFLLHFKILKHLNAIGIVSCALVVVMTLFWGDVHAVKVIIRFIPLTQFIPLFFAGTIFYKIYTHHKKLLQNYVIVIFCLISQILLFQYSGRSRTYINQTEYAIMLLIYFTLFSLFVNNKLSFIVSKWTLFLGKISFALYLIHQYISIRFIIPFLTDKLQVNFWIAAFLVALPIVIILASLITYYIEIPMSKRMKEKLRKVAGL